MNQRVAGTAGEYLLDKKFTFRARPHERHIADKDIPQLRKLVEAVLAEHTAKARYAGVAGARQGRAVRLGIDTHAPELIDLEQTLVTPHPHLPVQHGAGRIEPYRKRNQSHKRRQRHKGQTREEGVGSPLHIGNRRRYVGIGNVYQRLRNHG